MEQYLNQNVKEIEISGIRKFFNLVQGQKDMVSLTIGQPDFHTPDHIKASTKQALDQNLTTYTPNAGILDLRKAVSNFVKTNYNLNYHAEDEIIITVGASQAIDISLRTVITPGDEVILPGPVYPGYEPLIKLAGGKPVYVDTRENQFKLTAELIEKHITKKTKCVILPYPSNPTGVSLDQQELQDIADLLKDQPIFILADEIYSELTYEKPHTSIGSFDEVREQTLIVQGVSKSHSMTGFRIGFLLGPQALIKHILKVHQYNVSCATSTSQYAALEALTNGRKDPKIMRDAYLERRNYVIKRLEIMGIEVIIPDGAFYVFPRLVPSSQTSFDFGLKLVEEARLALVPGDAFSDYGQGYMRISYAYHQDILKEGMDRLESFMKDQ
ncbi:aminotransferase A [Tenuibacillus multivorans]|uniref:Aminotransferase n=1 Tax=Tenuibacillus multivorans TaxID=237069 RepID=A0A1G9YDC1_9BACI|nr:aminotransferase A [Tenuibacillus multivorans]GEL76054.1 aminotransferase [Tenuibacillus multivorans]SDN07084.1 aminotransferase [Tenuibacillus multivorans]